MCDNKGGNNYQLFLSFSLTCNNRVYIIPLPDAATPDEQRFSRLIGK